MFTSRARTSDQALGVLRLAKAKIQHVGASMRHPNTIYTHTSLVMYSDPHLQLGRNIEMGSEIQKHEDNTAKNKSSDNDQTSRHYECATHLTNLTKKAL